MVHYQDYKYGLVHHDYNRPHNNKAEVSNNNTEVSNVLESFLLQNIQF